MQGAYIAECRRFVLEGLPTNGVLGQKLWLAAKAIHKSPFSDELLALTLPQLDWIVEMIAKDNPDKMKISRGGEEALPEGLKMALNLAALWDSKRGKAKEAQINKLFNPEQMAKLKAHPRRKKPTLYLAPDMPKPN